MISGSFCGGHYLRKMPRGRGKIQRGVPFLFLIIFTCSGIFRIDPHATNMACRYLKRKSSAIICARFKKIIGKTGHSPIKRKS